MMYIFLPLTPCAPNEGATSEDPRKCKYYAYNYIFVINMEIVTY